MPRQSPPGLARHGAAPLPPGGGRRQPRRAQPSFGTLSYPTGQWTAARRASPAPARGRRPREDDGGGCHPGSMPHQLAPSCGLTMVTSPLAARCTAPRRKRARQSRELGLAGQAGRPARRGRAPYPRPHVRSRQKSGDGRAGERGKGRREREREGGRGRGDQGEPCCGVLRERARRSGRAPAAGRGVAGWTLQRGRVPRGRGKRKGGDGASWIVSRHGGHGRQGWRRGDKEQGRGGQKSAAKRGGGEAESVNESVWRRKEGGACHAAFFARPPSAPIFARYRKISTTWRQNERGKSEEERWETVWAGWDKVEQGGIGERRS